MQVLLLHQPLPPMYMSLLSALQRGHGPREPVDRRHEFSGRPLEGSRWIASGYVTRESDVDRLSAELCTAQRRLAQQQEVKQHLLHCTADNAAYIILYI